MIARELLEGLYVDTFTMLEIEAAGVTQAESMREAWSGGVRANWLLGHLLAARCEALALLGVAPVWSADKLQTYIPGSAPLSDSSSVSDVSDILAGLARAQGQLLPALAGLSDEQLAADLGDRTLAAELLMFATHEAFHVGQLCEVRKALAAQEQGARA